MYVKSVRIAKYRHLQDITLGPFDEPTAASDLIVIAGPNGGGKTSVLEVVSSALSGFYSLGYVLGRTAPKSSFEVAIALSERELEAVKDHAQKTGGAGPALQHITQHGCYFRGVNYPTGGYAGDAKLQNAVHNLVLGALRGYWADSLGFNLSSDRSFEKPAANKEFVYQQTDYFSSDHRNNFAFQSPRKQYTDMFHFLILSRTDFFCRLGEFHKRLTAGQVAIEDAPQDPYEHILQLVLPEYSFAYNTSDPHADTYVRIPSGETIPFSDLSSGEREVFYILSFFQRHNVERSVIAIDEPELHLHPQLARLLIRTLSRVKPFNQIWLATQSPEIIDEAGYDRVWYIDRSSENRSARVVPATSEDASLKCLRDFFGQSGYIGLSRAMVFTEGRHASADRQFLSLLFAKHGQVRFIPANGCGESERINRAVISILESQLAVCRFGLIRDRDFMTEEHAATIAERSGGRIFVLRKHEIENYVLDFEAMCQVLADIYSKKLGPAELKTEFHACACDIAGDVLRDMVAYRLNYRFRPQDFSPPQLLKGEVSLTNGRTWSQNLEEMRESLERRAGAVVGEMNRQLSSHSFDDLFEACRREVELALHGDGWLSLFPGKELLAEFARRRGVGPVARLQNAVVKYMSVANRVPSELDEIIARIVA